jgi:hypothetical protein
VEKLTDNEIVKALEICTHEHLGCEDGCPFLEKCGEDLRALEKAIRLINQVGKAKAEAIKEFAEKLKEYFPSIAKAIDHTAEEMIGGDNNGIQQVTH